VRNTSRIRVPLNYRLKKDFQQNKYVYLKFLPVLLFYLLFRFGPMTRLIEIWAQRARALWYNGTQLLSDGTLVVKGRVRPAGTQDESFRHTRWYRTDNRSFIPSEWCTVWQGTFRHLVQEVMADQSILR
jgi:hypothetical protein